MRRTIEVVLAVGVFLMLFGGWAAVKAAESAKGDVAAPAKEQPKPAQPPAASEVAKWVEQLDAPRFSDRQAASEKLAAVGKPAIAALAKAAGGDSPEVTERAIELLRKLLDSSDPSTREAAEAALKSIAKGERAAAARRAQEVLQAREQAQRGVQPGAMFQGGAIQFNVLGGGRRVTVRNVNGVKDTEADEDGRKIKIHDDPQQGIKIEVTSKKDGKDVTEKYEAKDAEELKKKHPAGHKLYEQYSQQPAMGMIQLQIQAQGGQGVPPPNFVPPQLPNFQDHHIRSAAMMLKTLTRHLEQFRNRPLKDASPQLKEDFKQQLRETKQLISELEKQLDEKAETPKDKPPAKEDEDVKKQLRETQQRLSELERRFNEKAPPSKDKPGKEPAKEGGKK